MGSENCSFAFAEYLLSNVLSPMVEIATMIAGIIQRIMTISLDVSCIGIKRITIKRCSNMVPSELMVARSFIWSGIYLFSKEI